MDRNSRAEAQANKAVESMLSRIIILKADGTEDADNSIRGDWTEEQIIAKAKNYAQAKAIEENTSIEKFLDGQDYYVRLLVSAAKVLRNSEGKVTQEGIDALWEQEYNRALPELSSKAEYTRHLLAKYAA